MSLVDKCMETSFSNVKYEDMAKFVDLNPWLQLNDIGMFNLQHSHIPTDLFQSIVEDMDVLLVQYGPLPATQNNKEASSCRSMWRFVVFKNKMLSAWLQLMAFQI